MMAKQKPHIYYQLLLIENDSKNLLTNCNPALLFSISLKQYLHNPHISCIPMNYLILKITVVAS